MTAYSLSMIDPVWHDPDTGIDYGADVQLFHADQTSGEVFVLAAQSGHGTSPATAKIAMAVFDANSLALLRAAALDSTSVNAWSAGIAQDGSAIFYTHTPSTSDEGSAGFYLRAVDPSDLSLGARSQTPNENGAAPAVWTSTDSLATAGFLAVSMTGRYVFCAPGALNSAVGNLPYILWDTVLDHTKFGLLGDIVSLDAVPNDGVYPTMALPCCWDNSDRLIISAKQVNGTNAGDWDRVIALSVSDVADAPTLAIAKEVTLPHSGTMVTASISHRPLAGELVVSWDDQASFAGVRLIPEDLLSGLDNPDFTTAISYRIPNGLQQDNSLFLAAGVFSGFHYIDVVADTVVDLPYALWSGSPRADGTLLYNVAAGNIWGIGGFEGPLTIWTASDDGGDGGDGGGTGPELDTPNLSVGTAETERVSPQEAAIETQRWLIRTAHLRQFGEITVDGLRLTIKRGVGTADVEPRIWVRANRDNKGFGKWAKRGLGFTGDRILIIEFGGFGPARDWQFEFATPDDCAIELRKAEIIPTPLGH